MQFNQKLHSSKLYNGFQFTVSALAVFSGSTYNSMKKHQETLTCFVAGTMILTASGLVAIENIKAGDKVISTYPETMETSPKTVLETYIREVTTLVHLTVNGEEIVTTVDHPFYVKNQGFIKAGELIVGDELLDVNGNVLLVENFDVELTEEPVKVYNFQVEDFHTYYVGENGVWVHNSSCTPAKKYLAEVDKETGDRLYKRTLEDGNEYQVRYTKGENGDYYARFEDFATHPDFPEAVYPSKKGLVLTGVEKEDLRMMLKNYGKPRGYTWHHLEDGKGMLLVETKIHSSFHHSGGATILRNIK